MRNPFIACLFIWLSFQTIALSDDIWTVQGNSSDYCRTGWTLENSENGQLNFKLIYDFKVMAAGNNGLRLVFNKPLLLDEKTDSVSVRLFNHKSGNALYFECIDAQGHWFNYAHPSNDAMDPRTLSYDGWHSYEFSPSADTRDGWKGPIAWPISFISIWLDPTNSERLQGSLYVGDIGIMDKSGQVAHPLESIVSVQKDDKSMMDDAEPAASVVNVNLTSSNFGNIGWDGEPISLKFSPVLSGNVAGPLTQQVDILDRGGNLLHRFKAIGVPDAQGNLPCVIPIPPDVKGYFSVRYRLYDRNNRLYDYTTRGAALSSVKIDDTERSPLGMGAWNCPWEQTINILSHMGIFWLRTDVAWSEVEPTEGQYNWKGTDQALKYASDHGMHILATMQYIPRWAATPPYHQYGGNPRDDDWQKFLKQVVDRYGNFIDCYEVWNEPDTPYHWTGGATAYLEHLKSSATVLRQYAPHTPIALGGVTGNTGDSYPFVDSLLSNGAANYFDILSYHYGNGKSAAAFSQLLEKYGIKGKRIWNTEAGFGLPDERILDTLSDLSGGAEKSFFFEFYSAGWDGTSIIDPSDNTPCEMLPMYSMLSKVLNASTSAITPLPADYPVRGFSLVSKQGTTKTLVFKGKVGTNGFCLNCGVADGVELYDAAGMPATLIPFHGWVSVPTYETAYLQVPATASVQIAQRPMIALPSVVRLIAGMKNTVDITIFNPSLSPLTAECVLSGSAAWTISRDSKQVHIPAGGSQTVACVLEPDVLSSGDAFRLDATLINAHGAMARDAVTSVLEEPLKISLNPVLTDGKAGLQVRFQNCLNTTVNADVKIKLPASWNSDADKSLIIPPGSSQVVTAQSSIYWPNQTDKNKSYFVDVDNTVLGVSKSTQFSVNWIGIPELANGIDWSTRPDEVLLNKAQDFVPTSQILSTWTGPQDLSVAFKWGWTPNQLHFHWDVTDDVQYNVGPIDNLWNGDSVQVWLAGHLYDLALLNGKPVIYTYGSGDLQHVDLNVSRSGTITTYDLVINGTYAAGDRFPFAFCVNDNDGEAVRKGWMYYLYDVAGGGDRNAAPVVTLM